MLNAIIIAGYISESRNNLVVQSINKLFDGASLDNNPDFIILENETSLKIDDIRKLQKNISLRPYKYQYKVIWIKDAHNLTIPAQQALLKTLEEPPADSFIFLSVDKKESLLPTILSRCQIRQIDQVAIAIGVELENISSVILKSSPGQKLIFADQNARTKAQASAFCESQIYYWQRELIHQKNKQIGNFIKLLYQTQSMLKVNVNPSLAIGNLLLSYPL